VWSIVSEELAVLKERIKEILENERMK